MNGRPTQTSPVNGAEDRRREWETRGEFIVARDYYAEINLHVVWHTKLSSPALTMEVTKVVYESMRSRCLSTAGAIVHAIGGIEDHVHVALSIPPTLLISQF